MCLTETECPPKQFVKIASAQENLQSFFAKIGLQGWCLRLANGLGKLCEDKKLKRCQSSINHGASSEKMQVNFISIVLDFLTCVF
jgi:hypothetical protein